MQLQENQLIKLFHKSCFSLSTKVIVKGKHNSHFLSLAFSFSYLFIYLFYSHLNAACTRGEKQQELLQRADHGGQVACFLMKPTPLRQEFGGNLLQYDFYKGNQCQSRPWNSARDRNEMRFLKIVDCICNFGAQYEAAFLRRMYFKYKDNILCKNNWAPRLWWIL